MQGSLTAKRLSQRCEIVLLAAEGKTNEEIGEALQITRQRAGRWRQRYLDQGRAGIEQDAPGRGRKPTYPEELRQVVVQKTTRDILAKVARARKEIPRRKRNAN